LFWAAALPEARLSSVIANLSETDGVGVGVVKID